MADRQVQIEFTKMKLELKRLLLSSIAILEEVQDQNPTTWDQLKEMNVIAAESGDLSERLQSLGMSLMSSFTALGADVNNIQFAFLHSSLDELEQEVMRLMVANPKVQAMIVAFQDEVKRIASKPDILGPIFHLYADALINIIPNLLQKIDGNCSEEEKALFKKMKSNLKETLQTVATGLEAAKVTNLPTNWESFNEVADREVNLPLMSVQNQVVQALWGIVSHDPQIGRALIEQVTSDRALNILREVANELTGTTDEEPLNQDLKDSNDKETK